MRNEFWKAPPVSRSNKEIKSYQNKNPQHVAEGLLPGRPLQILHLKILGKDW
jgi:hypothetical protein